MPYAIVKVKNWFKLKKLDDGQFMSSRPLSYEQAKRQAIAIYLSEHRKHKTEPGKFKDIKKKNYQVDQNIIY